MVRIARLLFLLVVYSASQLGASAAEVAESPDPDSLFGLTKIWDVHIQFSADQWQAIQPPDDINLDFGAAMADVMRDAMSGKNFHSEKSSRPGLAGYMGVDHQYGMATVTIDEDTIEEVGVRYKGNGTFMEGHWSGKLSFKIDFNRYHEDYEYRGLTKVNLNSCVADPSRLREALSYELFREAGIPSPRVAWAKVYLTITGESERKFLGLYELLEQVDKRFLRSRYGSAKGLLIKPATFVPFRYLGEDWEQYKRGYYPKTEGTPAQQRTLIEFARLVHMASESEFADHVEEYLDVDQFLNFLAVNVILSNLDSFLGGSQNYYAYLEPESNRIQMLPWDLDHSFASLGLMGNPDTRRNLSIHHPQPGNDHRLIQRMLSIPKYKQAYLDRIGQLTETVFTEERLNRRIDDIGALLRPFVKLEGDKALHEFDILHGTQPRPGYPHVLKYFVAERRASLQRQLSGESQGDRVDFNMPPGFFARMLVIAAAFLLTLALNGIAWLWGVVAGFRGSTKWGVLNLFFYPLTPVTYGFLVRQDMGRSAAIMTTVACCVSVVVFFVAAMML